MNELEKNYEREKKLIEQKYFRRDSKLSMILQILKL